MQLVSSCKAADLAADPKPGPDFCHELARKVRGNGKIRREAPGIYLERTLRLVLSDRVAFFCDVTARLGRGRLALRGEVERPEFKAILGEVFWQLGYGRVDDQVQVIPNLRQDPDPFALVTARCVLTSSRPERMALPMDEALLGEPVYVLKELSTVSLIKTLAGYWGYAPQHALRRVSRAEFIRYLNGQRVFIKRDCAAGPTVIPSGSRLLLRQWGRGKNCLVLDPAGQPLSVPKTACDRHDRKKEVDQLLTYARSFLKSPYNRGGKNAGTGIDCSGLIQLCYRSIGLNLPRDAKQQYLGGDLILPCLSDALLPGDALYFMNRAGQVDHTALYLGGQQVIHATEDRVKIHSINPSAANYLRRFTHEFIGAKRFWW